MSKCQFLDPTAYAKERLKDCGENGNAVSQGLSIKQIRCIQGYPSNRGVSDKLTKSSFSFKIFETPKILNVK